MYESACALLHVLPNMTVKLLLSQEEDQHQNLHLYVNHLMQQDRQQEEAQRAQETMASQQAHELTAAQMTQQQKAEAPGGAGA